MEYMVDKLCALCYDRAWYTKFGGCYAIQFFYSSMSSQWVFEHLYLFVKAQLFVIMDLSGDVYILKLLYVLCFIYCLFFIGFKWSFR